jgi:hypothetical protein
MKKDTNSGDYNSGDYNSGYCNSGNRNSGYCNSGYCNSGSYNSGNRNSGDCNSGNYNSGNRNSGYCNSGYCNSGSYNSGNRNSGDCNSGNYNSGYCNSVTPSEILVFNKPCSREEWASAEKPGWMYCTLTKWVSDGDMTDKEKEAHPSYVTTGGYLKVYSSMKAAFVDAWEKTTEYDRVLTKKLPNFDPHVFEEVFGFDPFKSDEPRSDCDGKTVQIDGKKYRLTLEE